jgi:uncharacterized protein
MKPSVYNFVWPTGDPDKVMIFNSVTTALAEIPQTHVELLSSSCCDYLHLPEVKRRVIDALARGGFVIDDEADELKGLKHAYYSDKYDRTTIRLVLAPTLACNFSCSYCFEKPNTGETQDPHCNAVMQEDVKRGVLNYVEQAAETVHSVFVTWYGGEPLLVRDLIVDLSQKIMSLTEKNKIRYSAGMITNGYLLAQDPRIVQKLEMSRVQVVHVTLDGPPDIHNSRRMLKRNAGPTFGHILEGIKLLKANGIEVYIRVNTDRGNINALSPLLDILENNGLKDVFIYLGQVIPYTGGCKSYENSCAVTEEFTAINQAFYEELRRRAFEAGRTSYYPRMARACDANRVNALVVGPDGDLYKCWTEVGNKSASIGRIGDLTRRDRQMHTRGLRWVAWEPFEYAEGLHCKMLPICMGGCACQAMMVNKDRPECKEWKYGLEQYIRARFVLEKSLKRAADQLF